MRGRKSYSGKLHEVELREARRFTTTFGHILYPFNFIEGMKLRSQLAVLRFLAGAPLPVK